MDSPKAQTQVLEAIGLNEGANKRNWSRWVILILIILLLAYFFTRTPSEISRDIYIQEQASIGDLIVTVSAIGTLQPTKQVEVGSEVSGIIQNVFVDFNDQVSSGQILAELDTQALEARLASVRASLAVAEASLAQAKATRVEAASKLNRSKGLSSRSLLSDQDLETDEASMLRAIAAENSAEAQVTSSEASLEESETALSKAVIRSPIDGIVISREIDLGQTVAASFEIPVMFIVAEDLSEMLLHLDIDESDIGQVREGQQALFRVDAYPGRIFQGEIISVRFNPREVNNIVTYETVLSVNNNDYSLRPGMTATADIQIAKKENVLLVSNQSLRFIPPNTEVDNTQDSIVWIEEEGQAMAIVLETGLSNGEFTEVLDGAINTTSKVIIDIEREPRAAPSNGPF